MLQRNHVEPPALALRRLKHLAQQAQGAEALDELLGIEGTAARLYFEHFTGMLKVEDEATRLPAFGLQGRNRRPPRDPVNALLSFAYSLLAKDLTIVCHAIGFDPFIGFYHQPRFGRPALALDLMEGFRPLVADSAVLSAINTRMVTESGRLATHTLCNEADSGSLALRLAGSPPEASPATLLRRTLGWLSAERAIDRVTSFQVTRTARLGLAHQMNTDEH